MKRRMTFGNQVRIADSNSYGGEIAEEAESYKMAQS